MTAGMDSVRMRWSTTSVVVKLILINVALYVGMLIWYIVCNYFIDPGGVEGLAMAGISKVFGLSADIGTFVTEPWTLFTYMFMHGLGIWHILGNMIFLYFFGTLLLQFLGPKRVVSTYILGGLMGGLAYLLAYQISPALNGNTPFVIGASGSVYAIMVAATIFAPNYEFSLLFLPSVRLRVWWLSAFFVLGDMISLATGSTNTGGMIAHMGGAFFGAAMVLSVKRGKDWVLPIERFWMRIWQPVSSPRRHRLRVKHRKAATVMDDYEYNARKKYDQEKIDAILDKISASGYDSLSREEKEFLFRQSNNSGTS